MTSFPLLLIHQEVKFLDKIIIIINGKGGSGKDTVCDIAAQYFKVCNISAITPIKRIASQYGWNGSKDAKSRKFLSDLKRAFVDYNDLPTNYLLGEYSSFVNSNNDILFVHIRENDQIDAFKNKVHHKCVTLLIRSPYLDNTDVVYGNIADDNVEDYSYDYYYLNQQPLSALAPDFMDFLLRLLMKERVISSIDL